jgi:hypothetical protein
MLVHNTYQYISKAIKVVYVPLHLYHPYHLPIFVQT